MEVSMAEDKKIVVFGNAEIQNMIYSVRGKQVMVDSDFAELYKVTTGRLNEQVKRNLNRFTSQFMFQLTDDEYKSLISQNAISKKGRGGRRTLPYVFTEQGIAMLSAVLKSDIAVDVSIKIMDAFVKMRNFLLSNRKIKANEDEPYNFLLEVDNLYSLKLLEKTHKGKIDVIYTDMIFSKMIQKHTLYITQSA